MTNYPYYELPRHQIDALGIETSYHEAGGKGKNGRFTLLLHGMSTSADSYRETIHELAPDFAFVSPDIPGFGYSEQTAPYTIPHLVEWLAAFCDEKGLGQVDIIGHSFGGLLAASFALAYPEMCAQLMLVAPAIFTVDYPDFLLKAGLSLGLVELGTAVSQSSLWVNRQIKIPFHEPDKQDPSVWARRLQDYSNARATADVIKAVTTNNIWDKVGQLPESLAIIWGENDTVLPISLLDNLTERIPHAQTHRLADCGHAPMLEQQAQFQAIVRDFLSKDS